MAVDASVAFVADVNQNAVTIGHSVIDGNKVLSDSELSQEIVRCVTLCFLSTEYRKFLLVKLEGLQLIGSDGASLTLMSS